MKKHKIAGLIGGIFALGYFLLNVFNAVRISEGFSFGEALFSELIIAFVVGSLLMAPAVILLMKQSFNKTISSAAWLYPVVLGAGMAYMLYADDALAAGLPMVTIVLPFCIIFSLALLLLKK